MVIFLMCGCSKPADNIKAVLSGISFTAQISFYNEAFVCEGNINTDGVFKLKVKEPENIEGMVFTVENKKVIVQFKGLSYTPSTGTSPFSGVAQYIYMILSDAKDRLAPVKSEGESFYIESASGEKYYKIILTQTGLPLSLEYPSEGLKVSFLNMTIEE